MNPNPRKLRVNQRQTLTGALDGAGCRCQPGLLEPCQLNSVHRVLNTPESIPASPGGCDRPQLRGGVEVPGVPTVSSIMCKTIQRRFIVSPGGQPQASYRGSSRRANAWLSTWVGVRNTDPPA